MNRIMKIFPIFISVFIFSFFLSLFVKANNVVNVSYVSNCNLALPSNYVFTSDTRSRTYYIPMSIVNNNSFEVTCSGSPSRLELMYFGYSNSIPSVNQPYYKNENFPSGFKLSSTNNYINLTDFLKTRYNEDYTYMVISCYANPVSDFNYFSFTYSVIPDPTPLPTPEPTPEPTPVSTPVPTPGASPSTPPYVDPEDDNKLDTTKFWTTCFDQSWKSGQYASGLINHRFVGTTVANFSDETSSNTSAGIHNYIYTVPIRIPFRIECVGFHGTALIDANYSFEPIYNLSGLPDDNINYQIEFSSPWIESSDPGISFNASNSSKYGYVFDIFNLSLKNGLSSEFYYCYNAYISIYSNHQFTNFGNYLDVKLSNASFLITYTNKISDQLAGDVLDSIDQGIREGNEQDKLYHEEEIVETERAIDNMNESVGQLTDTLSTWQIITLPFKVTGDLIDAITSSEGNTGITFPSVTIMDHQLWPSYTFDLNTIEEKFPLLITALHTISGIIIVGWFIHYLIYKAWAFGFI